MAHIFLTGSEAISKPWSIKSLKKFSRCEKGLVSVEWVALSAGVVVMAIIIGVTLMDGLEEPAMAIGAQLTITEEEAPAEGGV